MADNVAGFSGYFSFYSGVPEMRKNEMKQKVGRIKQNQKNRYEERMKRNAILNKNQSWATLKFKAYYFLLYNDLYK